MDSQELHTSHPFTNERPINIRERLRPELLFDLTWRTRCRVKILIVTDSSSGGFTATQGFHLGQVLNILADDPWSHIVFEVTKAHREFSPEGEVLSNFRFDSHNLEQYSQIWLFGISRQGAGAGLSSSELRAVSQFMDNGGGVFATGDHEDLGNPLAAQIPRVRSMRRWYYPSPGPNGEPVAPAQTGVMSHDTLVNGGTQTDADPQPIFPELYSRTVPLGSIVRRVYRYPHPVLCGPNGVINYLPDHMHEGHCEVPNNLGNAWTFDGQSFVEYPTKNGHQQRPEVIAKANNNFSNSRFGVLGAYDGHRVDVGRVVVDATWHHWFNINTLPYINASNPAHPTYKPATVAKWEEIKAYYRNVAVWLARPPLQRCIRNGGWLFTLGDFDVSITVRDLRIVKDPAIYFWQLGTFARDALGRIASQCQTVRWIHDLLYPKPIFPEVFWDPWLQLDRQPQQERLPIGFDLEQFEAVAIGAAVHAARSKFGDIRNPQELLDNSDSNEIEQVFRRGAEQGIKVYVDNLEQSCQAAVGLLSRLV